MSETLPIRWPDDGLIPAVIQDAGSKNVLMLGFMNREALELTRQSGLVHFWGRSRQKLWQKGETSGHVQKVRDILVNCELNSLLIEVEQVGAVCHDGYPTCYYRRLAPDNALEVVQDKWFDPEDVYGTSDGLRGVSTLWWGAYEFLDREDLGNVSGTSRRLKDAKVSLVPRISDELAELAGVLDGTHGHEDATSDLLLEASQVCYWLVCELVRTGKSFDSVRPDRALDMTTADAASPATVARIVRSAAEDLNQDSLSAGRGHALFALVASATVSMGVSPRQVIEKDLDDLRTRDYLVPYFSR